MSYSREKIVSLKELSKKVSELKKKKKIVAMCHGCFDILHVGHIRHLEAAKEKADILVVTITSDNFVNKGPNRPVFSEKQRAEIVAGLRAVDWVAINRGESAVETIKLVRPNLFVKGQEYKTSAKKVNPNFFAECKTAERIGAKVVFTYEHTFSSTVAFDKMKKVGRS